MQVKNIMKLSNSTYLLLK